MRARREATARTSTLGARHGRRSPAGSDSPSASEEGTRRHPTLELFRVFVLSQRRRASDAGSLRALRPGDALLAPASPPLQRLARVGARELDEQAHAVAGCSFADVGAVEVPCRPRDVEVRPGGLANEVRQEHAADDRAGLARFGRVVEVRVASLEQLAVLLVEWQTPDGLAAARA